MTNSLRRKISLVIMAIISGNFWYIFLVDGLCDTAVALPAYIFAQLLAIVLPFICCLIWDKEAQRKRLAFIFIYFVVLGICDYLHSFLHTVFHETMLYLNIKDNYMLFKNMLTSFMIITRMVLSSSLLSWTYKYMMILTVPKEERKKYKKMK